MDGLDKQIDAGVFWCLRVTLSGLWSGHLVDPTSLVKTTSKTILFGILYTLVKRKNSRRKIQ